MNSPIIYLLISSLLILNITAHAFEEDSEVSIGVKRGTKISTSKEVIKPPDLSKKEGEADQKENIFFKLNTKKTFEKVKNQNTLVFSIGNDDYKKQSGFGKLEECYSDVLLLKHLLIHCIKVNKANIFTHKDLTLSEFKKRIAAFLEKIKQNPEANVILTYSGHGNEDGSLVFVDGGMFRPTELKALINSFPNDTILILDACYSGGNEGPKEMLKDVKKDEFKSNSIRVYASLAHLSAKEIKYNNTFFSHLKTFYNDTLEMKPIPKGNGYFTAMVGMFFAEYKFKQDENISFKDLVSYATNRGKQYVEYLAMWGHENLEQKKHANLRLNQQPKILPVQERVDFLDENHNFILIQKYIQPLGLEPMLTGDLFLPMGTAGKSYKSGMMVNVSASYELFNNFFLSGAFDYISMSSINDTSKRKVDLNILVPSVGVKYRALKLSIFSLQVGVMGGVALTFSKTAAFGVLKDESNAYSNAYFGANINFCFELFKYFNLVIPAKFHYIGYGAKPLYGPSFGLGISYYF